MNIPKALSIISIDMIQHTFDLKVHGYFSYGSAVYQNKTPEDLDFIVVTDKEHEQVEINIDGIDFQFTFYTLDVFKEKLDMHNIAVIECYFLKDTNAPSLCYVYDKTVQDIFDNFELDILKLRSSISQISSNSYVKAKKKVVLEKDFDLQVGLKSLWHSFRMVQFGIDICTIKSINFNGFNDLYDEIIEDFKSFNDYQEPSDFWKSIHKKYKPKHNEIMSMFRKVAPKQ